MFLCAGRRRIYFFGTFCAWNWTNCLCFIFMNLAAKQRLADLDRTTNILTDWLVQTHRKSVIKSSQCLSAFVPSFVDNSPSRRQMSTRSRRFSKSWHLTCAERHASWQILVMPRIFAESCKLKRSAGRAKAWKFGDRWDTWHFSRLSSQLENDNFSTRTTRRRTRRKVESKCLGSRRQLAQTNGIF